MFSMLRFVLLALAFELLSSVAAASDSSTLFQVGVASVDVTPAFPIRLNGFGGRVKESEGVRQQLWAKALAVGVSDADAVVVITVDTLGVPDDLTERVAEKLKAYGLERSRLAICASHTHSGPMIRNCANTLFGKPTPEDHWQRILNYSDELEAKLVQVAVDALADRRPSRLSFAVGKVGFAVNRRTSGGPVDHDLPILAVHNQDGGLRAVLTNYACHCVTLSDDMISGDWAGYAMDHIQRRNPGCTALISIGCGADSNPRGGVLGSKFDVADALGLELAEEVQRLLAGPLRPLSKAPVTALQRVTLPLAPLPSREEWQERGKADNAIGFHARTQLARLDAGETLMTEISYPIQTISFGNELAWVFLPGEVVVDYALRLKQELDGSRVWMNAYANACPGYVPSERILREGGYEGGGAMVYYDIPGPYATGVEKIIVDTVSSQLKDKFAPIVDVSRTNGVRPLAPAEALRSLRTTAGYRVELAVAEPLTESPVAIAFGSDGRLWIAEMNDYPQGRAEGESGGQIRCVYDDNHDGQFDRSEIFLTGIPFPTGVTVWRDGVLVCAAPDVLYAEDTNGDGKADKVEKLLTGFATHNFQARVNSLEYGLDGWVYGSCGLFGGQITSTKTGTTLALGQRDFRFDPDTGVIEPAAGATQQGRVRNDWGDWFGCNNSELLLHYPLASHYLDRNPWLTAPQMVVGINTEQNPGQLFSISNQVLFMLSGPPGRPTAACGLGIYRDDLLGADVSQNAFTCEPVNNLVHRQMLTAQAATFKSRRDDDELDREFLASTDPWFRPVQVRTGPDGALWVVDMYRYVIEHPIWIPPNTLATLDTRAGSTMGRIYRIVHTNASPRPTVPLTTLHGAELAAAMETPNGTQRDLVQQLLQWNLDIAATPALQKLSSESELPAVRLQALATLANLKTLTVDDLKHGLRDPDAHVRREAVRISERMFEESPELVADVQKLTSDADAQVLMQVAYSAGFMNADDAAKTLAAVGKLDAHSAHLLAAIESSLTAKNVGQVLAEFPDTTTATVIRDRLMMNAATLADEKTLIALFGDLCQSAGASSSSDITTTTEALSRLSKFLDAYRRRPQQGLHPANDVVKKAWSPAIAAAESIAINSESVENARVAAVALLAQGRIFETPKTDVLIELLNPRSGPIVQSAVTAALSKDGSENIANDVLSHWATHEPRVRKEAVAMMLSRASWTQRLLSAIKEGTVSAAELDLAQQQALLDHQNEEIRTAASASFKPRTSANRQAAIDRYTAAINDKGDPNLGRQVFQKHCSNCHRLQETGHSVGPEIAAYSGKPVQALLIAMLDPNQAIDPRYQAYVTVLNDGRSLTGLIAEEAASNLTLLAAEGKRETVLRSEIEQIRSTGKSLMPEGFEQNASPEDVNNLWAWLKTIRQPPKSIEGNKPGVVVVPSSGNVSLQAAQAEIYGGDITFETPFQNIGYWHGKDDVVRWRIRAENARELAIWGEWACDPTAAGNAFLIEGVQPALTGTVSSTGAWSRYQLVYLGTTLIQQGESELVIRPSENLRGALADLRALHLVQVGGVPLATGMVADDEKPSKPAVTPAEIAARLIDDEVPAPEREKLIAANLEKAAEIIPLMAVGLPEEPGSKEEYRRIPWIWRVAVAVGKAADVENIEAVLRAGLPASEERLEHWQSVVIGGGLINGLTLAGQWPDEVLASILRGDEPLNAAWSHTLTASSAMADEESVPTGTRYDALRIVALREWPIAKPQLEKYLQKGVHDELQMGAVSGLADVREAHAAEMLIGAYEYLSAHNRKLALEGILRDEAKILLTLQAIEESRLPADLKKNEMALKLKDHANAEIRERAERVIK
jgi:putative membrane-bound dehydrogenase-like protein